MFLVRKNPKAGRPLQGYPIDSDPTSGHIGFKLGYCPCGEPVFIRIGDVYEFASSFHYDPPMVDNLWRAFKEYVKTPVK